jgi:hypothetical protein
MLLNRSRLLLFGLIGSALMSLSASASASLLNYADRVRTDLTAIDEETAFSGYTNPELAVGAPDTGHTPGTPSNSDLVSLGQNGSVTLAFDQPVQNHPVTAHNPWGYDLLAVGNTFQGDDAAHVEDFVPQGPARFQEQGLVEVAQTNAQGEPKEWYFLLPRIFDDPLDRGAVPRDFTPDELVEPTLAGVLQDSGDIGPSASLFDGFADSVPVDGQALAQAMTATTPLEIALDDPSTSAIEGIGGSGLDLGRAVTQTSRGMPKLGPDGGFQFVELTEIDLVRITDARAGDQHDTGAATTEVDGLIDLPHMTPEPGTLIALLLLSPAMLMPRRARAR